MNVTDITSAETKIQSGGWCFSAWEERDLGGGGADLGSWVKSFLDHSECQGLLADGGT